MCQRLRKFLVPLLLLLSAISIGVCVCSFVKFELKIYINVNWINLLCPLHRRHYKVLRLRFHRQSQLRRSLELEHCIRGKWLTYASLNTHTHTYRHTYQDFDQIVPKSCSRPTHTHTHTPRNSLNLATRLGNRSKLTLIKVLPVYRMYSRITEPGRERIRKRKCATYVVHRRVGICPLDMPPPFQKKSEMVYSSEQSILLGNYFQKEIS